MTCIEDERVASTFYINHTESSPPASLASVSPIILLYAKKQTEKITKVTLQHTMCPGLIMTESVLVSGYSFLESIIASNPCNQYVCNANFNKCRKNP